MPKLKHDEPPASDALEDQPLSPREEAFAYEVATSYNQTSSYMKVYEVDEKKVPRQHVSGRACDLAHKPNVAKRIKHYRRLAADAAVNNLADTINDWIQIAEADPNDLIKHRVGACRHCHGDGFLYQWRDEQEWAQAIASAMDAYDPKKDPEGNGPRLPDNLGGYGFNANIVPHEYCPKCDGRGIPYTVVADTDTLTGAARRLYAGVKVTRDGLQVLMRDQDKARENLARVLGAFTDNVNIKGKIAGMQVSEELNETQRAALDGFFAGSF